MNMLKLIRDYPMLFLSFMGVAFFSGIGQTFFLSIYNADLMQKIGLSRTQLSSLYACATLVGSFNLTYLGVMVDRWNGRRYLLTLTFAVATGLLLLSYAPNAFTLFFAYLILRAFGQMGFGLFATTSISRLFYERRGKAISVLGIGRSLAEGVLPNLGAILATSLGAFVSMKIVSATVVIFFIPFIFLVLPKIPTHVESPPQSIEKQSELKWSWRETFKNNKRSILLMISLAFIPFSVTALFFQQATLADERGWTLVQLARGFWFYSACLIVGDFTWGPLVDRFRAINLYPFVMLPLLLGLTALITIKELHGYFIYMMFLGLSVSLSGMLRHTLYAELFGVLQLGRIKGMDGNILIIGTSLGPLLSGLALDYGVHLQSLLLSLAVFSLVNFALITFIQRSFKKA